MFRWIYYVFRNLIYYRVQRPVGNHRIMTIASARSTDDIKDALTEGLLATVGLKIVEDDADTVPWYIPLSKVQKSWVEQVSRHGYKVGLT